MQIQKNIPNNNIIIENFIINQSKNSKKKTINNISKPKNNDNNNKKWKNEKNNNNKKPNNKKSKKKKKENKNRKKNNKNNKNNSKNNKKLKLFKKNNKNIQSNFNLFLFLLNYFSNFNNNFLDFSDFSNNLFNSNLDYNHKKKFKKIIISWDRFEIKKINIFIDFIENNWNFF